MDFGWSLLVSGGAEVGKARNHRISSLLFQVQVNTKCPQYTTAIIEQLCDVVRLRKEKKEETSMQVNEL